MLVGATGAGKTELAKALAKYAFEGRMTRVDCNELTESHAAQRLIGAPPGYVGSENGGQLTRDIMRLGSGVILLDEVEKAHEAVLRVIMGLLDEGRLTEASTGQTADASKFLIVMTSNAEHDKLAELVATVADEDERRRAVKDTLTGVFRPEQLARIDDVYCFGHLDRRAMVEVVGKFLLGFAADAGVQLVAVDSALLIDTVLRHEKGAKYGIRELVRLVERAIVDGMLDRRAEGFRHVAIQCQGDAVEVVGVPAGEAKAAGRRAQGVAS
jgi:ATP-dependent Clp protease ATP-binding subunit ClpA